MATIPNVPPSQPISHDPPNSPSRRGIERELTLLVDHWSIHSVLHALVEVCYAHAAEYEKATDQKRDLEASNWRQVCRSISHLEGVVSRLRL